MRTQSARAQSLSSPDEVPKSAPAHERIAVRAYELYLERGATDGHDLEDWLDAEREFAEDWRISLA